MKLKKCLLITILSVLIILNSLLFVSASENTLKINSSSVNVNSGNTVEMNISVAQNPGTWSIVMVVAYDGRYISIADNDSIAVGDVFTESEFTLGSINVDCSSLSSLSSVYSEDELSNMKCVKISAQNTSISSNNTNTGNFVTIKFNVSEDAPTGNYPVQIIIDDPGNIFDLNTMENVPTEIANGTINVTNTKSPSPETTYAASTLPVENSDDVSYSNNSQSYDGTAVNNNTSTEIIEVTDASGNVVTDSNGNTVTEIIDNAETTTADSTIESVDTNIESDLGDNSSETKSLISSWITWAVIALVVIAIIVTIIIIIIKNKKSKNNK